MFLGTYGQRQPTIGFSMFVFLCLLHASLRFISNQIMIAVL